MTLSDISIRRSVFAWMLMSALIVFGAISFLRLGISQMPDVEFNVVQISVTWEGAAPEIIEAELVDQIEQKVISAEGLKEMRSSIQQGSASVELEFFLNRDVDAAIQEIQTDLSQLKLPLNVDPPKIKKNSADSEPIMWVGISGKDKSLRELIQFVDGFLQDQFQIIPGVGEVRLGGFADRNLRIWVSNDKLRQYELTILDVVQAVELEHTELAGGYMENDRTEVNVRTMGEGMTPEQVGNILITKRGGEAIYDSTIHIHDIARVEDGLNDIRRLSRITDGTLAVSMGISKQRGSNEIEVGRLVKNKIDELNKNSMPPGMKMQLIVDFTRFAEQAVHHTERELLVAGLLTALLCFLFLGSWSSSVNIILSIPTSVIGTFTIIYFAGFTLNTFTLLGLALSIGVIVDDAIMVLENIVRHFSMGKNRVAAARDGAREITFAAIAATFAVVAIFLPVAFMQGIIGKFFFQFGVTITAAVLLSLVEAITLTPMRCSQLLQRDEHNGWLARMMDNSFARLAGAYRRALEYALHHRVLVVAASLVLFALSLMSIFFLRKEFVPPQDQNMIRFDMRAPVGSSMAYTNAKLKILEDYMRKRPEVLKFFSFVGSAGPGGFSNNGGIFATLVDKTDRKLGQTALTDQIRADIKKMPEMKEIITNFTDLSTKGLVPRRGKALELNIRGLDYAKLREYSIEIKKRLAATGLVTDVDDTYRTGMPELRIIPDREAAARRGVSMDNIGRTINAAVGGIRQGKYTSNGRRYDARVRLEAAERLEPQDASKLQVRTNYGELIPLSDVVTLEVSPTIQSISRVDRQRAISINANMAPGKSQADAVSVSQQICRDVLPPGYTYYLEGGSAAFAESFGSLGLAFILGVVIAYMVLASQFNSFIHPATILIALPYSLTGAGLALLLTNQSLNLYSALGLILLMGIVKKNSILLVEFTNKMRYEQKMPLQDALLKACPIRLRPILMTSIATMASALPSALGVGAGSETRVPMAMTIIGGVLVSTSFTLFVVPCLYSLMARFERQKHQEEIERIMSEPV